MPFLKQTIASRRTATFGSRAASSWSSGRYALTSPGCVRERPSSAISAEPRTAGLSSSKPRRSSSSFWRKRNCAIDAVCQRANPVVGVARGRLDLVVPLAAKRRELALEPALRVLVGEGRGLRRDQSATRRERPRAGADIAGRRPDEPAQPLLLQDVRRPARGARAREHRRRELRRDLGDVEHDRRPELDVRREHAIRACAPAARRARRARAPPRPRTGASRDPSRCARRSRARGSSAR